MDINKMMPGAKCCIEKFANIENENSMLIITDKPIIADALTKAAADYIKNANIKAQIDTIYLPDSIRPVKKITKVIKDAILDSDIIFTPVDSKKEEMGFRNDILDLASKKGGRKIFHMVSVTENMFRRGMSLALNEEQFTQMETLTKKIAIILSMAKNVRIQTEHYNTDIEFGLGDWNNTGIASTGVVMKGSWGNLPSGEAFILPESFSSGKVVIDCAITHLGALLNPIHLEVNKNGIVDVENNGDELIELFSLFRKKALEQGIDESNVKRICEFGIGTNPNVKRPGEAIIEIEKILGTVHIGVGDNRIFGGDIKAPSHIDMVITRPTITIDSDQTIISNGKIREDNMNSYLKPSYITFDKSFDSFGDEIRVKIKSIAKEVDRKLCRFWEDKRKNTYYEQIGCDETARMANKMWNCINKEKTQKANKVYDDYNSKFDPKIEPEKFFSLISVMERFGVLQIEKKTHPPPAV